MKVASWVAPQAGSRRAVALAVLLLSGCSTADEMAGLQASASSWRVIERLGEARYRAPDAAGWTSVAAGSRIPGGAEVRTGTSGRVIVAARVVQVSAGPESLFTLPDPTQADHLSHHDGRLRYRLSGKSNGTLKVVTPHAALIATTGVFDVVVEAASTEVEVESGQLRLVTTGGQHHATLFSGESALARGRGRPALAVRDAPGLPYQRVEEVALAALPSPPDGASTAQGTRETPLPEAVEPRSPMATPAVEPSPSEHVGNAAMAGEVNAPELVDDGVAAGAAPAPTRVESVAMEPFGAPAAVAGSGAVSGPTVHSASQPPITATDASEDSASESSVGAMQISASFPHAEEAPPLEIVPAATEPDEARQIYGRLATGMLERLPSASE
jgi:hypothetical protein